MAGKRKPPTLRVKDDCFVAAVYAPDGKRTQVSFGSLGMHTQAEIYTCFGQWIELFNQFPHKVLAIRNPFDAIKQVMNPKGIVSVGQLYDKHLAWAVSKYPLLRDGRESPDLVRIRRLGKFLEPYRPWPVSSFGSEELNAVVKAMLDYRYRRDGHPHKPVALTRTGINHLLKHFHRMWSWGMSREVTTFNQVQLLKDVGPLRVGRTEAMDLPRRRRITQQEFDAVVASTSKTIGDMLRLLWLTAMRPAEACRMRPFDILQDKKECWLYIPGRDVSEVGDHKTAYRQRLRVIPLAAQAQEILVPRIKDDPSSKQCIFRPIDGMKEFMETRHAGRITPMNEGNVPSDHPMIVVGEQYGTNALRQALLRACERAGVEAFTPYDLRRTAATRIRAGLGKEATATLLGHASSSTTEIYLLEEVQQAMKAAVEADGIA